MIELELDIYLSLKNTKQKIGSLLQSGPAIFFEYDAEFIELGIEISPFKLPLKPGVYCDKDRLFSGLPGVFYDSLPDGWGLLLMDRYFRKIDIDPITASPLERLAYIGDRALGAISYEPNYEIPYKWQNTIGLESLAADCEIVLHGKDNDVLPELIIAGGSPGGARPKVAIGYNEKTKQLSPGTGKLAKGFQHYIVKFSNMIDVNDIAEVEYAYSLMAHDCEIDMPQTRLFDAGKHGMAFGVERFDRIQNQRLHMHTLCGLLHADYRAPNLDYNDFLKATWLLTRNIGEVVQAYRRMVFNVLTHNRDDHSKNFTYIMRDNTWYLSPAYDLTFSAGIAGEHTMTIAGEGANPTKKHLLAVATKVNIDVRKAVEIIEQTKSVIAKWTSYANQASMTKSTINRLKKVLDNFSVSC